MRDTAKIISCLLGLALVLALIFVVNKNPRAALDFLHLSPASSGTQHK